MSCCKTLAFLPMVVNKASKFRSLMLFLALSELTWAYSYFGSPLAKSNSQVNLKLIRIHFSNEKSIKIFFLNLSASPHKVSTETILKSDNSNRLNVSVMCTKRFRIKILVHTLEEQDVFTSKATFKKNIYSMPK